MLAGPSCLQLCELRCHHFCVGEVGYVDWCTLEHRLGAQWIAWLHSTRVIIRRNLRAIVAAGAHMYAVLPPVREREQPKLLTQSPSTTSAP